MCLPIHIGTFLNPGGGGSPLASPPDKESETTHPDEAQQPPRPPEEVLGEGLQQCQPAQPQAPWVDPGGLLGDEPQAQSGQAEVDEVPDRPPGCEDTGATKEGKDDEPSHRDPPAVGDGDGKAANAGGNLNIHAEDHMDNSSTFGTSSRSSTTAKATRSWLPSIASVARMSTTSIARSSGQASATGGTGITYKTRGKKELEITSPMYALFAPKAIQPKGKTNSRSGSPPTSKEKACPGSTPRPMTSPFTTGLLARMSARGGVRRPKCLED